jgi:glycosyltransferase involved in cell wall biosynthesis
MRHQVTRQLARFYNVLYVELSPQQGDAGEEWQALDGSVLIFRPRRSGELGRKLRAHFEYFQRRAGRRLARRVERAIEELGYEHAILVNFQFDLPEIMESSRFVTKLYLCNDDFQSGHRWWTRAMHQRAEAAVIAAADACLAVSPPLLEMLRKSAARAELFLPGHEFAPGVRKPLRKRERPIRVCYMGFVNARLRVDWLADLARQPQIELTLVGPIEEPQHSAELLAVRTVRHIGALTGEELQAELQAADVLVMPYDTRQAAVRAISAPNKLFQYLACGRPVVCSDLPSLMQLPHGFLYVAANSAQFAAAVNAAFDEDTEVLAAERLDFSAGNTWNARGDRLQQLIQQAAR